MTRARLSPKAMRAVVEIRELQRSAAQSELCASDAQQRSAEAALAASQATLGRRELEWCAAHQADQVDLDLAGVWAQAVALGQAAVVTDQLGLETAEQARDDAAQALRAAEGRLDIAAGLVRRLDQQARRRREEARLNETSDRAAWRRTRP